MNKNLRLSVLTPLLTLAFAFAIGACAEEPKPPKAVILAPDTAALGTLVLLDGTDSSDPEKAPLSYRWDFSQLPLKSQAVLNDRTVAIPSFVADVEGTFEVQLVVFDGELRSSPVTHIIEVGPCGGNQPVVGTITSNPAAPAVGESAELSAVVSDTDNDAGCDAAQGVTYLWSLVAGPAGTTASLLNADWMHATFVADLPGDYLVQLMVTDSTGLKSNTETLTITVGECGLFAPTVTDAVAAPVAPNTGDLVVLTITVDDTDNAAAGCNLAQELQVMSELIIMPAGSNTHIGASESFAPTFFADLPGSYTLRTTVTDSTGLSSYLDTVVDVVVCGSQSPLAQVEMTAPQAIAASAALVASAIPVDSMVQLSAAASSDPDNSCLSDAQRLSYHWTFTARPSGSTASFSGSDLVAPEFVADMHGTYQIEMEVSDGEQSAFATLSISVDRAASLVAAPSYTVEFVAGGDGLWSQPEGLALDDSNSVYVIQNGSDSITRTTTAGVTDKFSEGLWINDSHDIVFDAVSASFFVTNETDDALIKIDATGSQILWSTPGEVVRPAGITLFDSVSATPLLAVIDQSARSVRLFDPTDVPLASRTTSIPLEGALFNNPWGVAALFDGTADDIFWATNTFSDEIRRSVQPTGTIDTLVDVLNDPHDIVLASRSDALIVADTASGRVLMVDNCVAPPCRVTPLLSGLEKPWGLTFEDASNLLITDRQANCLYRLKSESGF